MRYLSHLVHIVHSFSNLTTQVALSLHRELFRNAIAIIIVGFHKKLKETPISDSRHQNIVVAGGPENFREFFLDRARGNRPLIHFRELDCLDNIGGLRNQRVTSSLFLKIS